MPIVGAISEEYPSILEPVAGLWKLLPESQRRTAREEDFSDVHFVIEQTPGEMDLTHPQEIAAIVIQAIGHNEADTPCDECVRATRSKIPPVFVDCISVSGLQNGACGSCVMKHRASFCSRRKLFSHLSLSYTSDMPRHFSKSASPSGRDTQNHCARKESWHSSSNSSGC